MKLNEQPFHQYISALEYEQISFRLLK